MDDHVYRVASKLREDAIHVRDNETSKSSYVPMESGSSTTEPENPPRRYCIPVNRLHLGAALCSMSEAGVSNSDQTLNEIVNRIEPGSKLVAIQTNFIEDNIEFYFEV
jgi:hypothetical protein